MFNGHFIFIKTKKDILEEVFTNVSIPSVDNTTYYQLMEELPELRSEDVIYSNFKALINYHNTLN